MQSPDSRGNLRRLNDRRGLRVGPVRRHVRAGGGRATAHGSCRAAIATSGQIGSRSNASASGVRYPSRDISSLRKVGFADDHLTRDMPELIPMFWRLATEPGRIALTLLVTGFGYWSLLTPPICPVTWQPVVVFEVDRRPTMAKGVTFMSDAVNMPTSPLVQEELPAMSPN